MLVTNFEETKRAPNGMDAFVRSIPTADGTTSPSEQEPFVV
ncbi:hypothetical protein D081_1452 [Anaerovibrio sp. JC8]|nr:hypothetical protein D081_1452 [Anaerovibrio sp. JC8]